MKGVRSAGLAALVLAVACAGSSPATKGVQAFPGAEGFGSDTPGGRGGRVIAVTNLDDSGPGSLRAALEAEGPRIVVFRTGGTIVLEKSLTITNPFVTIAGQTAPGGGIQIRNDPTGSAPRDSFVSLRISTHDVVVRYLRIRPGTLEYDRSCDTRRRRGKEQRCAPPNDIRAMVLDRDASRVVIDHVSAGWSTDEIVGIDWAHDVTIQWCLLAEALSYTFYDPRDPGQGKGMTFGNKYNAARGHYARRVSVHHNLFASNEIRNPQATSACGTPDQPEQCLTDVRNNVVYNWGKMGTLADNIGGHNFVNVVGNVYKAGPDTRGAPLGILDWTASSNVPGAGSRIRPFLSSNLMLTREGRSAAIRTHCSRMGKRPDGKVKVIGLCEPGELSAREAYAAPSVQTEQATRVFDDVLAQVGASLHRGEDGQALPARDATDARIVRDVRTGGGRILRRPEDFMGWPSLARGAPPADGDADGMPDAWETLHGFDPRRPAPPGSDADGDGYTDIEEYLNGTDPHTPE